MKALVIKDLKKIYPNGVQALKEVSFDIEEGDYFALLGPNGAGKTTIIGILTSLVKKTAGQVFIFGHNIEKNFSAAKACIGVVPQELNINMFETVETIVLDQAGYYGIPRKIARQRIKHYLQKLGLWEKRKTMARFLSGGMKRRLMIARALIHEPRMLILDEPTAGVDVELRRSMWQFLTEINRKGITIILTTHYLEEAESQCRNIAIINQGNLVEYTSMSDLLKKLDYESFVLYLHEPISQLPMIEDCKVYALDKNVLEIEVPKRLGISSVFAKLHQQGISVESMRNKTSRLEELFLRLTGLDAIEQ